MKFQAAFLTCLLLMAQSTFAIKTEVFKIPGRMAATRCMSQTLLYPFGYNTTLLPYYAAMCNYQPVVGTVLQCVRDYAEDYLNMDPDKAMKQAYWMFYSRCPDYTDFTVDQAYLEESYLNSSKYIVNSTSLNISEPIYVPIHMNLTGLDIKYKAYLGFYDNLDMSNYYGGIILLYWGVVLFISFVFKVLIHTRLVQKLSNPFLNYIRSFVTTPTLTSSPRYVRTARLYFHCLRSTLATRLESIILAGYVITHIAVVCVRYSYDEKLATWPSKQVQIARYVGDRFGIIAFAHIPLITLFGGRNNFFQWLTGFNHANFIQFHKWTGRIMFIDLMIHSACWTNYMVMRDGFVEELKLVYFQMGIVATIFGGLIVLQSIQILREKWYELFLFIHIVFALLFIWTCWEHCLTIGWMEWLYASVAIWGFDRAVRLARLVIFGFPNAKISLIKPANAEETATLKIVVSSKSSILPWHCSPGQYGFVYFLSPTMFWQSHPFTIMDSVHNEKELIMFVKPKNGLTKRLAKRIGENKSIDMRLAIEGPYGESSPSAKYENVLLIGGGNGVPGPLDHLIKLSGKSNFIRLCIVQKTLESLVYFKDELEKLESSENVVVDIYLTRGKGESWPNEKIDSESSENGVASTTSTSSDSKKEESDLENTNTYHHPRFNYHVGRPDVKALVGDAIKYSNESGKSLAVVSCGPEQLCGDIRQLVSYGLLAAKTRVDLYEELQVW